MLQNIRSKCQSLLMLSAKIVDATQKKLSKKTPGKCLHINKVCDLLKHFLKQKRPHCEEKSYKYYVYLKQRKKEHKY